MQTELAQMEEEAQQKMMTAGHGSVSAANNNASGALNAIDYLQTATTSKNYNLLAGGHIYVPFGQLPTNNIMIAGGLQQQQMPSNSTIHSHENNIQAFDLLNDNGLLAAMNNYDGLEQPLASMDQWNSADYDLFDSMDLSAFDAIAQEYQLFGSGNISSGLGHDGINDIETPNSNIIQIGNTIHVSSQATGSGSDNSDNAKEDSGPW